MRCAEFERERQSCGIDVRGDDRRRPGDLGRHDRTETDRTGAERGEARSCMNLECVQDRPGAGLYTASERTHQFERNVLRHADDVALVGEGVFSERRLTEEMVVHDVTLGIRRAARSIQPAATEVQRSHILAMRRMAGLARVAQAARHIGHHDMVADGDRRHIRADGFDDAGSFMAEDHRQRRRIALVPDEHVSVTHAAGDHADKDLGRAGRGKCNLFEQERSRSFAHQCRAHRATFDCVLHDVSPVRRLAAPCDSIAERRHMRMIRILQCVTCLT